MRRFCDFKVLLCGNQGWMPELVKAGGSEPFSIFVSFCLQFLGAAQTFARMAKGHPVARLAVWAVCGAVSFSCLRFLIELVLK